jgi:hypothetical protein
MGSSTIWVVLLSMAGCALASGVGYDPAPGTQLSSTTFSVTIAVETTAVVWGSPPAPLVMTDGNSWFSTIAWLNLMGNVPSDVSAAMTTNNLPANVYLQVCPSTPAQVSALESAQAFNGNSNWQAARRAAGMASEYLAPGAKICSWTCASSAEAQPTGLQVLPSEYAIEVPLIYSIIAQGGPPPAGGPVVNIITYTVTVH